MVLENSVVPAVVLVVAELRFASVARDAVAVGIASGAGAITDPAAAGDERANGCIVHAGCARQRRGKSTAASMPSSQR